MPFTLSHPAIILPLLKYKNKIFSPTGLIIGSIIPDFEAFLFFKERKQFSHSWYGILYFDLPSALLFSFIFHYFIRNGIINNSFNSFYNRFYPTLAFNWFSHFRKNFIVIIFSFIVGILSHFFWDSFTHMNLSEPNIFNIERHMQKLFLYDFLQYTNSIIGLFVCFYYVYRKPQVFVSILGNSGQQVKRSKPVFRTLFWLVVIFLATAIDFALTIITKKANFIMYINNFITGLILSLIITSAFQKSFMDLKTFKK